MRTLEDGTQVHDSFNLDEMDELQLLMSGVGDGSHTGTILDSILSHYVTHRQLISVDREYLNCDKFVRLVYEKITTKPVMALVYHLSEHYCSDGLLRELVWVRWEEIKNAEE